MDRRLALVTLWAVFAAAAVGVGFGAAGLVGDPFSDGSTGAAPVVGTTTTSRGSATGSPPPSASSSPSQSPRTGTAAPPGGDSVTRTLSTVGGLVSATCTGGLVRLSASPAVGWEIDDLDSDPRHESRARFERSDDGDGRVEVRAACDAGGVPRFELDNDTSGHGNDDDGHDD